MTNFKIPEIDYSTLGRNGFQTINVSVVGFWSTPITIHVSREARYGKAPEWRVEVSHSSGGYEGRESPLKVERNFGEAILAAINVAEEIESKYEILETNFQIRRKEDEDEEARIQAKRQADIDADPQITKEQIDQLMKDLDLGTELRAYNRGSDEYYNVFEKSFSTGRIYFTRFGKKQNISIAELRTLLTDKSARSCIVKKS